MAVADLKEVIRNLPHDVSGLAHAKHAKHRIGVHRLLGSDSSSPRSPGIEGPSSKFSLEEQRLLMGQFRELDENHDGYLSRAEFVKPLSCAMQKEMAQAVFRAFDSSKDERISEGEFMACMQLLLKGTAEEKATFVFRMFDLDGNGHVEWPEFRGLLEFYRSTIFMTEHSIWDLFCKMGGEFKGSIELANFKKFFIPSLKKRLRQTGEEEEESGMPLMFGSPGWNIIMPLLRALQIFLSDDPPPGQRQISFDSELTIIEHEPAAFQTLRQMFGYTPEQYLQDMGADNLLENLFLGRLVTPHELSTSSKSGSFFFLSPDHTLIIKTVKWFEAKKLLASLDDYMDYFYKHPDSLLTKFCSVFEFPEQHLWCVVMRNLVPTDCEVKVTYDLKGSSYNRSTPLNLRMRPTHALKDNDLVEPLKLQSAQHYATLMQTIKDDTDLLVQLKCIDYSLLVCVVVPHRSEDAAVLQRQPNCFPSSGAELYFIAIIDMLLEYNALTKPGTKMQMVHDNASWKPPPEYSERFNHFMQSAFAHRNAVKLPHSR